MSPGFARFAVTGAVFGGLMLNSSCGIRYETMKPPANKEKAMKSFQTFKWQPPLFSERYSRLPLPKSLEKRGKKPNPK